MRRGHSLPEALCALVLGGILAAASGRALQAGYEALWSLERRTRAGRAEREAVAIVRAALVAGEAVVSRGDTAVELDVLLGTGTACAVDPAAILLPAPGDSGMTAMPQLPVPDDLLAIRGWTARAADWWYAAIDSVQLRARDIRCGASAGWGNADGTDISVLRLVVDAPLPVGYGAGSQVQVFRRGRFALYHAGRGEWALGWRRCHPFTEACGPIQPVAAPLVAPGAGGFSVRALPEPARWHISARGPEGRGAAAEVTR